MKMRCPNLKCQSENTVTVIGTAILSDRDTGNVRRFLTNVHSCFGCGKGFMSAEQTEILNNRLGKQLVVFSLLKNSNTAR